MPVVAQLLSYKMERLVFAHQQPLCTIMFAISVWNIVLSANKIMFASNVLALLSLIVTMHVHALTAHSRL